MEAMNMEGLTMKTYEIPVEFTTDEIEDYREGTLIDSVLYWHNGEYIAFIESYANCWTSCYEVFTGDEAEAKFE